MATRTGGPPSEEEGAKMFMACLRACYDPSKPNSTRASYICNRFATEHPLFTKPQRQTIVKAACDLGWIVSLKEKGLRELIETRRDVLQKAEEAEAYHEAEQAQADDNGEKEADRKAKEEADRKAKEEADRKAKEEADRKAKEEADRKAKQSANNVGNFMQHLVSWTNSFGDTPLVFPMCDVSFPMDPPVSRQLAKSDQRQTICLHRYLTALAARESSFRNRIAEEYMAESASLPEKLETCLHSLKADSQKEQGILPAKKKGKSKRQKNCEEKVAFSESESVLPPIAPRRPPFQQSQPAKHPAPPPLVSSTDLQKHPRHHHHQQFVPARNYLPYLTVSADRAVAAQHQLFAQENFCREKVVRDRTLQLGSNLYLFLSVLWIPLEAALRQKIVEEESATRPAVGDT